MKFEFPRKIFKIKTISQIIVTGKLKLVQISSCSQINVQIMSKVLTAKLFSADNAMRSETQQFRLQLLKIIAQRS